MGKKKRARKPIARENIYLKFGFVITEHENHYCPRCNHVLNAGPNYQPKYCGQCGQKISFAGTIWKGDKELGFAERGETYEPVKNRVVRPYMEPHHRLQAWLPILLCKADGSPVCR